MDMLEQEIGRMQMELDLLKQTRKELDSGALDYPEPEDRDRLYARINMLRSRIEARKRLLRKGVTY